MGSSQLIDIDFFTRPATDVARDLIGCALVRMHPDKSRNRVLIVSTEAFEDGAESGMRSGMKHAPGQLFIMSMRGHKFLNVGTDRAGFASCVMVRGIMAGRELVDGPGKVSTLLGVDTSFDGKMIGAEIRFAHSSISVSGWRTNSPDRSKNSVGQFHIDPVWNDWLKRTPIEQALIDVTLKDSFRDLCREVRKKHGGQKEREFRASFSTYKWTQAEVVLALDEFRDTSSIAPFEKLLVTGQSA